MGRNEFVAVANYNVTGLVVRSLLPFNPFRSTFSVTLPFSTIIFWSVPVRALDVFCFGCVA